MPTYPIDIVDQAYEHNSRPLSAQVTKNLYPEVEPTGKVKKALISWPGKATFSTGSGTNRGIYKNTFNSSVFVVNGTDLYKVDSAGVQTSLGTIAGTDRCVFDASAYYLYIVTGGRVWRTDGASLTEVTDSDLETPNSTTFLNSQMIYDGDAGRFAVSDAGDGSSIDGLNYGTAESKGDDLTRVYAFDQALYLFGVDTIEPWYNSGTGNPPFDRIEGGIINIGIAGIHAVTNTKDAAYFLGGDKTAYKLKGYQETQISTIAINNAFESYADVSDCFCDAIKYQGQDFVIYTFPTADKTWVYNETNGSWFEIADDDARDIGNGYCWAFGKNLVTDHRNGNIYYLDRDTNDDVGDILIRERVIRPITAIDIGKPGQRILMSRFELIIETGVGLASGQGVDPVFMLTHSADGGRTWQDEQFVSPGVMGDYLKKVEYFTFASGYELLIKIRVSDPIKVSIHAAAADLEEHGY